MDRKIYQAEEKTEAKRIKELEAMKDKKRQPEEKQQVGSLTQKVTASVCLDLFRTGTRNGWEDIVRCLSPHCFWHFHLRNVNRGS